jgi:hypothetical protein
MSAVPASSAPVGCRTPAVALARAAAIVRVSLGRGRETIADRFGAG